MQSKRNTLKLRIKDMTDSNYLKEDFLTKKLILVNVGLHISYGTNTANSKNPFN